MSDACRVYGTEIFNLIEPLFTYLVQKLNPQFNFQKIQQLHSQNISLMDGLPFVCTCDHVKNCIECYNVIVCALSKGNRKTADKFTETATTAVSSPNCDIPLRKIEAGLSNITKEFLSLGIPSANAKASSKHSSSSSSGHSKSTSSKSNKEKRSSGDHGRHHSSSSSRHKSHHDSKSGEHKNKSTAKHDSGKRHSSEKRSSSGSGANDKHKSSKSASSTSEKKRRKDGDSDEKSSSEDESGSKRVSKTKQSSGRDSDSRKRSTSERCSNEVKKQKKDSTTEREHKRKSSPVREVMSPSILIEDSEGMCWVVLTGLERSGY